MGLQTPGDFEKYYTTWATNNTKALGELQKKGEITIYLKTSNMTVVAANAKATPAIAEDATMNLNVVTGFTAVNLILDGEFTAQTALVMDGDDGEAAVYDITLPANEKAFDLNVKASQSVALVQAAEETTTNIGLLTTWASNEDVAEEDSNHGYGHDIPVKGMVLGEGLAIDAFNPQAGDVVVDGAEISAYGLLPVTNQYYETTFPKGGYTLTKKDKFSTVNAADGKAYIVNVVKVFSGDNTPQVTFETDSKPAMEKMIVTSGAKVEVKKANVAEIVGEDKNKSEVTFTDYTVNKALANLLSISKVTIKSSTSPFVLNKEGEGLSAEIIDDCVIFAEEVNVFPEAGLNNTTFKYTVYNATSKKDEEKPMEIKVIPPVQSKATPDYTYTFTKCNFQADTKLYAYDNGGYFAGATPIIDPETGEWAYRMVYHYAEYDATTKTWEWKTTYDESKVPELSKKLGYVLEMKEYFYSTSNKQVSLKDIDDYDVIIALDECTVNGKAVTKNSGIFELYNKEVNDDYDINEKFAIGGKVYIPIRVELDESEDGENLNPELVYLIAEE